MASVPVGYALAFGPKMMKRIAVILTLIALPVVLFFALAIWLSWKAKAQSATQQAEIIRVLDDNSVPATWLREWKPVDMTYIEHRVLFEAVVTLGAPPDLEDFRGVTGNMILRGSHTLVAETAIEGLTAERVYRGGRLFGDRGYVEVFQPQDGDPTAFAYVRWGRRR